MPANPTSPAMNHASKSRRFAILDQETLGCSDRHLINLIPDKFDENDDMITIMIA